MPTPVHIFTHESMATVFEIRIRHEDAVYARQAAADCFRLLDRIESELSRYHPNSDIARLNVLQPGETLQLGLHAFTCVKRALILNEITQGAFDICIGALKDDFTNRKRWWQRLLARRQSIGKGHLHLLDDKGKVAVTAPVRVDLGGIGKGYAVDCLLDHLREWDIEDVLISGGASSIAARGGDWPVTLRHPQNPSEILARLELHDKAMGASGLEKGAHIIDPRRGRPARDAVAAWVIAADATTADAFSTALMVLSPKEAQVILAANPELAAMIIYHHGKKETIHRFNFLLQSNSDLIEEKRCL